ncbi:MAG: hypothetical protein QG622_1215 [Actinomycetota bacterium]|nr:hypothetical protein [Actinomycetota bacterium]
MTGPVPGEHERQSVSRPFLAALHPTTDVTPEPATSDEPDAVRPYFVTQGRVHDDLSGFETVYSLTPGGAAGLDQLSFEHRDIAALCRQPQSVVEISALLKLPLGVTTVLTRDLATQGYLTASQPVADPASDPSLIMRLINAVHAL